MTGFAGYAEEFIARRRRSRPGHADVAATMRRLCAERGAEAVGEALAAVYTAKEPWAPPSAHDFKRRRAALTRLHRAVEAALKAPSDPMTDAELRRWLTDGGPLVQAALDAHETRRASFKRHLALDREALEARFRRLGAGKREAEAIVSAAGATSPPGFV